MEPLTLIPVSGAAGIAIAIVTMLAILSGIGILIRKVKQRSWAYYFLLFVMFAGVMLLFDQVLGMHDLRISVITSLSSSVLFTLFYFLLDRKKDKE
ncbi:MAG: hypothetical protein IJK07_03380 [Bacteroidales bacterium]|nr:hypothetical protein [Bacteroidales bacterium]